MPGATGTLQGFLVRNAGVAEGRLTRQGAKAMQAAFAETVLVVDECSLASTVQARDRLRIANALRVPRVVLVGDAKQLDAVDAGKPFAQLQAEGMKTPRLDAALTVFELAEIKGRGDVQGVVLMLVVFLATQRMYHGTRTRAKAIVIDEAWDLLSGEDSAAWRRARVEHCCAR